jgi:uncharacterized cupredoxin-like copper-binding protein
MKISIPTASALVFIAGLACTVTAMANGQHAGAHLHDKSDIGRPGTEQQVTRTIEVEMTDSMKFEPAEVSVHKDETIHFIVHNGGKLRHEFLLGTQKALKEHAELMKKFPMMEHEEPSMASVQPGQTGHVIWQFTKSGKVPFACLQPGHFDAGMKGSVTVGSTKAK